CAHQLDLLWRKWLRHFSCHRDHPYDTSLPQERSAEQCAVPADPLDVETDVFRIGQYVWDVDHSALERRSPRDTAAIQRSWMLLEVFLSVGRETIPRGHSVEFAVRQEDEGIRRLAKVG